MNATGPARQGQRMSKRKKAEPVHTAWRQMRARCLNSSHPSFHNYGGRGIKICHRWLNDFAAFKKDMGPKPQGQRYSLERIDNAKGYSPKNCRWATYKEQGQNRRYTVWITFNGRTMCATDWARELGIWVSPLLRRLRKWPVEIALTLPKQKNGAWRSYATGK